MNFEIKCRYFDKFLVFDNRWYIAINSIKTMNSTNSILFQVLQKTYIWLNEWIYNVEEEYIYIYIKRGIIFTSYEKIDDIQLWSQIMIFAMNSYSKNWITIYSSTIFFFLICRTYKWRIIVTVKSFLRSTVDNNRNRRKYFYTTSYQESFPRGKQTTHSIYSRVNCFTWMKACSVQWTSGAWVVASGVQPAKRVISCYSRIQVGLEGRSGLEPCRGLSMLTRNEGVSRHSASFVRPMLF